MITSEMIVVLSVVFLILGVFIVALLYLIGSLAPRDFVDERGRRRCHRCRKLIYADGPDAEMAAQRAVDRGLYLRAYYERNCGRWHLSSQERRRR